MSDDMQLDKDSKTDQDALAEEWSAALEESKKEGEARKAPAANPVELDELIDEGSKNAKTNPDLDVILDIPVKISMEVGATSISIRNLLQLNQGSVIELDRLAGEPLDVLVNGTLIAHGEVVVVNEKFGIRMTDVISPSERIKRLR